MTKESGISLVGRPHVLVLILLIGLSLIVKFWGFDRWFGFDYDQEINAWIAKRIVSDSSPTLIGPETSTGGMYVGPFFNYLITLFFWLGGMEPAATLGLSVVIAGLTIALIYVCGKAFFSVKTGLLAAFIYGFSAMLTSYDRVLWNPTPIPLVFLGILYSVLSYRTGGRDRYLYIAAALVGFMFHLHFVAFIILGFFLLALMGLAHRPGIRPVMVLSCAAVLFFFLSPLIFFDLRHSFLNGRHFLDFLLGKTGSNTSPGLDLLSGITRPIAAAVGFSRAVFYNHESPVLDLVFLGGWLSFGAWAFRNRLAPALLVQLAVGVGVLAFIFYRGPLPTYYLSYLFPVFVLISVYILNRIVKKGAFFRWAVYLVLVIFASLNITESARAENGLSLANKKSAVNYIVQKAGPSKFTVDYITEPGLRTGYPYLFWLTGRSPVVAEGEDKVRKFKIVVPSTLVNPMEIAVRFGGVGVIEDNEVSSQPQTKNLRPALISGITEGFFDYYDPAVLSHKRDDEVVLVATGNIIPARKVNSEMAVKNDWTFPFQKTADFLRAADIVFINFEAPLFKDCQVTQTGMRFCGHNQAVDGLVFAGVDVASLANNHSGDYGGERVRGTVEILQTKGIKVTGHGQAAITTVKDLRFGFLGYNDIGGIREGVAWAGDGEKIRQEIMDLKKQVDFVVVTFHWGPEYVLVPDKRQRELGHLAVDAGADLIIGNHPHWVQGVEWYKEKLITYAHGNFVFDQMWSQETREGVLGKYVFNKKGLVDVSYFPVIIEDYVQPRWANREEAEKILGRMKESTDKIKGIYGSQL